MNRETLMPKLYETNSTRALLICLMLFFGTISGRSQAAGKADSTSESEQPLFQSEDPLDIIIEMDIEQVINDKSEDPEYLPARLTYKTGREMEKAFDIKIHARGHSRRTTGICDFPPLKLNFKKGTVENTLFHNQDKIKLVTHCRDEEGYGSLVFREYLIYKIYNFLTDKSYKVRLARITYRDARSRFKPLVKYGFLIEDDDLMAARIDGKKFEERIWDPKLCEDYSLRLLSLFQYMIGNTDWWAHMEHNIELIETPEGLIPVPFDFDLSGAVNAPYALPSTKLPLRNVRQRMYKGPESEAAKMQPIVDLFNEQKVRIYSLYEHFDLLNEHERKELLKYYDKFYDTINNPRKTEEDFYTEEWKKYFTGEE